MKKTNTKNNEWYVGRWNINYGNPDDYLQTVLDVVSVKDGFVIGMSTSSEYTAVSVTSILKMTKNLVGDKK